jgi:hypothetical protein
MGYLPRYQVKPQEQTQGRRMSGRLFIVLLVVGVAVGILLVIGSLLINSSSTTTTSMTGVLLADDSGQFNGLGGHVTTYNVTLAANGGVGSMNLTLIGNGTDIIQNHIYDVSGLTLSPYNLTMTLNGQAVNLGWISNSTVWKAYNNSYIASTGPAAPPDQLYGSISPSLFPGIKSNDYLALILTIGTQPTDNIPFVLHPGLGPAGSTLLLPAQPRLQALEILK